MKDIVRKRGDSWRMTWYPPLQATAHTVWADIILPMRHPIFGLKEPLNKSPSAAGGVWSHIHQRACHITDEETITNLQGNPYMQYFVGLHEFHSELLSDSSIVAFLLIRFLKFYHTYSKRQKFLCLQEIFPAFSRPLRGRENAKTNVVYYNFFSQPSISKSDRSQPSIDVLPFWIPSFFPISFSVQKTP